MILSIRQIRTCKSALSRESVRRKADKILMQPALPIPAKAPCPAIPSSKKLFKKPSICATIKKMFRSGNNVSNVQEDLKSALSYARIP